MESNFRGWAKEKEGEKRKVNGKCGEHGVGLVGSGVRRPTLLHFPSSPGTNYFSFRDSGDFHTIFFLVKGGWTGTTWKKKKKKIGDKLEKQTWQRQKSAKDTN